MPSKEKKSNSRGKGGPPREVESRALKLLGEATEIQDPVIVSTERDKAPDGTNLYKITAAPKGDPNGPHASIVVDSKGSAVAAALFAEFAAFAPPTFEVSKTKASLAPLSPVTIDPKLNELTLRECETFEEIITVTVPKQPAAKADVYFLADTTGSMSSILAAVRAGANAILNAPQFAGRDIAFGVGNYKDFPTDPYAFDHQLSPTTNKPAVAAAINTWNASGGADTPEGQLFALHRIATSPSIGWRANSERILVWFGDAPGHDPVCSSISGLPADLTAASVTADLQTENITVLAISTNTRIGLDADPDPLSSDYGACAPNGGPNQATDFANATGGQHVTGINPANIVSTIITLVNAAVSTINNLNLVPTGATAPFVLGITPAAGYGPLPGDREHVLRFRVTFKGVVPCRKKPQTFVGTIDVVADGAVVARKRVVIRVPACRFHYSVKFVCGTQEPTECRDEPVRPGIYSTEINIHNPNRCPAKVKKRVIPVVLEGKPLGREPKWSGPRGKDRVLLPPDAATMDDCYRLSELLFERPQCRQRLTIGFLAITSDRPLEISAVYTASDLEGRLVSLDVESIEGRRF